MQLNAPFMTDNEEILHPCLHLMRRIHEHCVNLQKLPTGVAKKQDWLELQNAIESGVSLQLSPFVSRA